MEDKFNKWRRVRSKGKWHFIVKYGVLCWGLGTVVLFSFIMSFMPWEASFLSILKESLALFTLGGIVWGAFIWLVNEKSYKKHCCSKI